MKRSLKSMVILLLAVATSTAIGCGAKKSEQATETAPKPRPRPAIHKVTDGDIDEPYRVYGSGYPLIMVMGYSGTQDTWDPTFLDDLAKEYKVITFDNRGMGETTAGTREFTIPQFADDTAGFMDALGIQKANVFGWSMGTYISQELVLNYPQKVDRLVLNAADPGGPQAIQPTPDTLAKLTDTSGTPEERGMRLMPLLFPQEWISQKKNLEYVKETLGTSTLPSPAESVNKQTQATANWQGTWDRLPTIESQTMLATGMEDVLTPP